MTRDELAIEIFKKHMGDANNLGQFEDAHRLELFDIAAQYAVEMADALFRRLNDAQ